MWTRRPADGARRITRLALLTAIALTIFMAEAQIPVPVSYTHLDVYKRQSHAAAGAITGVTVGTIVALAYMLMNFLITRGQEGDLSDDRPDGAAKILKELLMIAVPITISSSMVGIVTVIDSSLVQGQLQRALLENPDTWALYQGIVDFTDLEQAMKAWQAALPQGSAVTMALLEQSMAGQGGQAEAAMALHTTCLLYTSRCV